MGIFRTVLCFAAGVSLAASSFGCGKKSNSVEASLQARQLDEIYRMIQLARKRNSQPATDLDGFKEMKHSCPFAYAALEKGECIMNWEGYSRSNANDPNVILAYEKEVPTQGGSVVMMDGKVKTVSVQEFLAKKPGPK